MTKPTAVSIDPPEPDAIVHMTTVNVRTTPLVPVERGGRAGGRAIHPEAQTV